MPKLRQLQPRLGVLDTRRVKPAPKRADPFYLSPEWRALMRHLIAMRGRRCEQCGASGCRIYGDHIHELSDDGAMLDAANVQLLCHGCHSRKTAAARGARARQTYTP